MRRKAPVVYVDNNANAVSNIANKTDEPTNTQSFLNLFDQIWNNPQKLEDIVV